MKDEAWATFSFTEMLKPPDGWQTDCAILSTYSADLVVVVTALLALTGCDLDNWRKGSRVELVKAIEILRGRACVVAQAGRVTIPNSSRPILKLLDKFVRTVDLDEETRSWHPKAALIRYRNVDDISDRQWRVWVGSRNLTRALNWEAGLVVTSRSDGKGQRIDGLAAFSEELAYRANLPRFPAKSVRAEFSKLTWECPAATDVHELRLLGPGVPTGFPTPQPDAERVFVISPFLDPKTVQQASKWGGKKARRTLVSTPFELQRLLHQDANVFAGFEDLRTQPLPELPAEGAEIAAERNETTVEPAESEETPPPGLHAKLLFAAKGARRQLWLGSANATARGWQGRNFEVVAQLSIGRDTADGLAEFVAKCDSFKQGAPPPGSDEDEEALESARKLLSARWTLRQRIGEAELEIIANSPPPLTDAAIKLEIALLGGQWSVWQSASDRIRLPGLRRWQRSDFLQVRVSRGNRVCAWLQIAPCEPAPDDERDHALIAQYLNPQVFLMWLRSMLTDEHAETAGGDWDADDLPSASPPKHAERRSTEIGVMPTIEEILRSWAKDPSAFLDVDQKVRTYLTELQRRAAEGGAVDDVQLLNKFQKTWDTLAVGLR
jgi:hypothetical protein